MVGPGNPLEEAGNPLFRRGIPYAPMRSPPVPAFEEVSFGPDIIDDEDLVFTGFAGSDGSLPVAMPVRARRGGWAAVSVDDGGELRFAIYGTCQDRCPSSHRAEIRGILEVVKRARFPLRLVTDHQSAVKAFRRGRAYCCDSHRAAADIWRQIWACLDEAPDADSFLLVWVKGHTDIADVLAGKLSEADHKTNVLADRFAGEGAIAATGLRPNCEQVEAFGKAVAFYKVLRKIADEWPEDYRQDRAKPPPRVVCLLRGPA